MRPVSNRAMPSNFLLQDIATGQIVVKIQGSVKKLGVQYQDATVVLYNKTNLQPIAVRRPDQNGDYRFLDLNIDLKTYIVAFDRKQQYNAVIQDNVRPK